MVQSHNIKRQSKLTLQEVESALAFKQPKLSTIDKGSSFYVQGIYLVNDDTKTLGPLATYEIEMTFPKSFPNDEPIVTELRNRIEPCPERHVNPNGTCCICVWEDWIANSKNTSVKAYCDGPLANFFLSQVYYEQEGIWPFGERPHGSDGVIDVINDLLGKKLNKVKALEYVRLLSVKNLKGHSVCPCGSGRKLRDCCRQEIEDYRTQHGSKLFKGLALKLSPEKLKLTLF